MFRNVRTVHEREDARVLTELFVKDLVALVVDDEKRLLGILTKMDLVDHLTGSVNSRREGAERS
jgi:CBS-domain-containing membrane protein